MSNILESLHIYWQQLVVNIVGFLLLFLLLKKLAWGPFMKLLDDRRDEIQGAYDGIEEEQARIAELKKEYEAHLAKIEEEAHQKLQDAILDGQEIARKIEEDAKLTAEKIIEKSHSEIVHEIAKAKVQLRDFIVESAVYASEKVIRERLDDELHRRLIENYIEELADVD